MKRKTPKFLRLFMVLALVAGTIGALLPVSPARAAVTSGDVAVTLSTTRAATVATYTLVYTSATTVPSGGTVSVTFPAGTTVPSSIGRTAVSINGVAPSADPVVVSRTVTITNSSTAATGTTITIIFTSAAGIKNTSTPSTARTLTVATSADADAHTSAVYVSARGVSASPTAKAQGGAVTLSGVGFTAGTTATASGSVTGSAIVAADGTVTISGTKLGATGTVTVTDGLGLAATATVTTSASITATGVPARPGQVVTIEGRNFTVGQTITARTDILLGGAALAATNVVTTLALSLTDRDLDATLDDFRLQIRVPSGTAAGVRRLSVTDGTLTATANIEISAQTITISPTSGPIGTQVTISGAGFPSSIAGGVATNQFSVRQAGVTGSVTSPTLSTDTAGGFANVVFTVPATNPNGGGAIVAGSLTITANIASLSGDAGLTTGAKTFTVTTSTPNLSVSPSSGPRGTSVVLSGSAFTASATVAAAAALVGGAQFGLTAAIAVGADGNLTASTRTIPAGTAYGSNTITVTSGTRTGVSAFTATQPTIAISPASGTVGTSVTVTGSGWLANGLVTITRGGTAASTVTADAAGDITAQLPIPSTLFTTGGTVLVAIGANDGATSGNIADGQTFTISSAVISVTATTVAVGGSVTVSGVGFLPFTGLGTLSIGGVSVLPTTPTISSSIGSWSATLLAPGLVGVQTLTVIHGTVTRTATLTITSVAAGTNNAVVTATALQPLIGAGVLELAAGVAGGGSTFQAFVPGLAGNPLASIQPNSVLILTLSSTTTIVVSGVTFTVQANTPAFIPVGATVTITIQ